MLAGLSYFTRRRDCYSGMDLNFGIAIHSVIAAFSTKSLTVIVALDSSSLIEVAIALVSTDFL